MADLLVQEVAEARRQLEESLAYVRSHGLARTFLNKSKTDVLSDYLKKEAPHQFVAAYYVLSGAQHLPILNQCKLVLEEHFAGAEASAQLAEQFSNSEKAFRESFTALVQESPAALALFCADLCNDFLTRFEKDYKMDLNDLESVNARFEQDFDFCEFHRILDPAVSNDLKSFCLSHKEDLSAVIRGEVQETDDFIEALRLLSEKPEYKALVDSCQRLNEETISYPRS